jgi:serine kinase of HPr protein (carbohydrate metabolism regulator)
MSVRIHATSVAIDGMAVLLLGRSGSGKSDLALRLIDRGAMLISDDYTELTAADGALRATPPATIAGRIEVRGIGIVAYPYIGDVTVGLAVRLDGVVERMPSDDESILIAGIAVRAVTLDAFDAATPIKVELALAGARERR